MAELADAQVSEACGVTPVEVQVLFRAPLFVSFENFSIEVWPCA